MHSIRPIDVKFGPLSVMRTVLDLFNNEASFLSLGSKSDRRSRNCECSGIERSRYLTMFEL